MSEPTVRRCVLPGSYDPVTNGHVDIVHRAARLYDEVVVAILHNPAKAGTFDIGQRTAFLEHALETVHNVRVASFADRLLVDVCREVGATALVKGLRGASDVDYELPMALMNRHLTGIETVFLPADPSFTHISSSLVREVARFGGDVSALVPSEVSEALVALRGQG